MANYFFLMNSTGTCAWRVYPIMRELHKQGHKCHALNTKGFSDEELDAILDWADVLTFQMVAAMDLIERAREKGIYTIFDCDDYIDKVPPKHPSFKITQDKNYQALFKKTMRHVDLITVSSPALVEHYKQYNPNIVLLPNYIPVGFWERPVNPNRSTSLRFGWAGGVSHQEDLDFIAPVIEETLNQHKTTKFIYTGGGGWSTSAGSYYQYGEDQFKDIPLQRREFNPGSRIEMWPDRLNSMQLDVAMAPLDKNEFSVCKTPIKYYEYAINHWPGVYQQFLYGEVVKHGKTGFVAETHQEWEHYLNELITKPELRQTMAEAAYQDVLEHYTFDLHKEDWLKVYLR